MSDHPSRLRKALKRIQAQNEEQRWTYGTVGRLVNGVPTFDVVGRAGYILVTIRQANGAQTTPPARNDVPVPKALGLPVRMRMEGTTYVIDSIARREDLAYTNPAQQGDIHLHDNRYFTETEILNPSEQAVLSVTDRFLMVVSGVLKWASYGTLRDAIRDYYNSVVATLTNKSIDASTNTLTNINTSALAADAVSNPKLANMAQGTIKGRQAGSGTGDPEDLTAAQAMAILKATQLLSDAGFVLITDGTNGVIERQTTATSSGLRVVVDLRAKSTGNVVDGFGPGFFFSLADLDIVGSNLLGAIGAVRDGNDTTGLMQLRAYIAGVSTIIATLGQNGLTFLKHYTWPGQKRVSSQFNKTNTALADVTGLSVDVEAGKTYNFRATLHITASAAGGLKVAIGGTCTATSIIYFTVFQNSIGSTDVTDRHTALGGSSAISNDTIYLVRIEGNITVNAAGTLVPQFAQNVANGTSSVLVGSTFIVNQMT